MSLAEVAVITPKLSHFQILDKVGAGGMGTVYRCFDQNLQRTVALKVLPQRSADDAQARARFLQEAQAASALNHPHIVTIYEVDSENDVDFIAMELIEGRPLDEVIGPGLATERALRYGMQIADALAAAHERGVVHRDLKPQNVMITARDEVKILDFGLAKRLTSSGVSLGATTGDATADGVSSRSPVVG